MTQVTRFAWPIPVMGDELGYSREDDPDPESLTPTDWAASSNNGFVQVGNVTTSLEELVEGLTVTTGSTGSAGAGGPLTPSNPSRANDRDYLTRSERLSGIFLGSPPTYWWAIDLGSAVEVSYMDVDDPISSDKWLIPSATANEDVDVYVEWSDDNSSWTSTSYTYSSSTTPTGLVTPATTTRHTYTINSPSSHRYWRIRKEVVAFQFMIGDGMAEWWIYGTTESEEIIWTPAPAANDGDPASWAFSNASNTVRVALQTERVIGQAFFRYAAASNGTPTYTIYGADDATFEAVTQLASAQVSAVGSFTPQEFQLDWQPTTPYQYFEVRQTDGTQEHRRWHTVSLFEPLTGYSSVASNSLALGGVVVQNSASSNTHFVATSPTSGLWLSHQDGDLAALAAKVTGYQAHGNLGATETFDAATGWHSGTLDADCTFTLTAAPTGTVSSLFLELAQDGTGGWTITLPASVANKADIEAAQDTTADGTTFLVLLSRDGGTSWYGGWWGSASTGGSIAIDDGITTVDPVTDLTVVGAGTATVEVTDDGGGLATLTVTASASVPADDTHAWMPLTTVVSGEPVLVWDGDDNLIPTLTPI